MYPENPEGTQVFVVSMNMGYISDTARNRTHTISDPFKFANCFNDFFASVYMVDNNVMPSLIPVYLIMFRVPNHFFY